MWVHISLVYSLFTLFEYIYESGNYIPTKLLWDLGYNQRVYFSLLSHNIFIIEHAHCIHKIIGLLGTIGSLHLQIHNVQ